MRLAVNTVVERIQDLDNRLDSNVEYMNNLENQVTELFEDSKEEFFIINSSNDLDEQLQSYDKHVSHERNISFLNRKKAVTLVETKALAEEKDFLLGLLEQMERVA